MSCTARARQDVREDGTVPCTAGGRYTRAEAPGYEHEPIICSHVCHVNVGSCRKLHGVVVNLLGKIYQAQLEQRRSLRSRDVRSWNYVCRRSPIRSSRRFRSQASARTSVWSTWLAVAGVARGVGAREAGGSDSEWPVRPISGGSKHAPKTCGGRSTRGRGPARGEGSAPQTNAAHGEPIRPGPLTLSAQRPSERATSTGNCDGCSTEFGGRRFCAARIAMGLVGRRKTF